MKRSGSQSSSSSSHSVTWTERNAFPSYEDLFYRPPKPADAPNYSPKIMESSTVEDENEGPIRALLDEMRDWYEQSEESETRFRKPLPPPPPVEESDDEDAIRKPFGAARALRKVLESSEFLPISPTPPLRLKTSIPSTPSTATLEPKTPTAFPAPHRPFADVPQSPIFEAFVEAPSPRPPLTSSVRSRSSSLPAGPPKSLKPVRSETSFHRPPPLKPSSKSLGMIQDHVLLHPGFNKSFSAPSTPTASEFMQAKADKHAQMHNVSYSPYNSLADPFAREGSHLRTATYSRWSLSTTAQDDIPSPSPISPSQPSISWKGLPRSPSRLGLGRSFAKFDFMKLVRLPSRVGNKKRLIIKGEETINELAVQCARNWCEAFGAVDRVSQKNGEIHVHFRNRAMPDRVCRTHTNVMIPGVGFVSLACATSSRQK